MIFLLLIVIQVGVFGTLLFVLRNILKRHFGTASSHLEVLTQDSEQRLSQAKKRTDEANTYYEETVSKAKADGEKIKQQLIEDGLKEKQELLERARKESEEIMDRAKSARGLMEEEFDQKIKEAAAGISLETIQATFSGIMSHEIHSEWINVLMSSGLNGLSRLNIPHDIRKIEILSAFPLTPAQKKTIASRLSEHIGKSVELEEKVDPKLILGIRLSIGSVVIDGSLAWKLKEALKYVRGGKNS